MLFSWKSLNFIKLEYCFSLNFQDQSSTLWGIFCTFNDQLFTFAHCLKFRVSGLKQVDVCWNQQLILENSVSVLEIGPCDTLFTVAVEFSTMSSSARTFFYESVCRLMTSFLPKSVPHLFPTPPCSDYIPAAMVTREEATPSVLVLPGRPSPWDLPLC